jgi:transcriptional regulator with XRE-family HTH domain
MTAEPPAWAARLREERCKRGWSQRQMALRIYRAADERVQAGLPRVEHIVRRIVSYESGTHRPRDPYLDLYSRAFGIPRDVLFGPGGSEQPYRLPLAADADGLSAWITSSNTTDEAIDRIGQATSELAVLHTRQPPRRVLEEVMQAHRQVQALVQSGRQRLRQTRDLLRIDADLLAHASLLLDDIHHSSSAEAHGRAALLFAGEAGTSQAMAYSAQAKTARWRGMRCGGRASQRYFSLSADLARQGFENSNPARPVRVLLANQEASAAALLGDAALARQALKRADQAADSGPAVVAVTAWSCPRPRMALYALSVALRLHDPDAALRSAAVADELWEAGEPRAFGVWSLIHAGAGIAHVMKGDLAAAAEQLALVAQLPSDMRISTITGYLEDMDTLLRSRRFADIRQAADMREQITAFITPVTVGVRT